MTESESRGLSEDGFMMGETQISPRPLLSHLSPEERIALERARKGPYIEVFSDAGYQGNRQELPSRSDARYNAADLQGPDGVGIKTISSMRFSHEGKAVGHIYSVVLYAEDGCRGASKSFTTGTDFVGDDFNDRTVSIQITNWKE